MKIAPDFLGGPVVKICLAMKGTQVRSLVPEDSTCGGTTWPRRLSDEARALEPMSCSVESCQEPVLRSQRGAPAPLEKAHTATKTWGSFRINT